MKTVNSKESQSIAPLSGAVLTVRVIVAFVLLGLLLALLYWCGFHSYRNVAEWLTPGDHEAFVYGGDTYYLSGEIGQKGLTLKKYPLDQIIGEIRDDGVPAVTESITQPTPDVNQEPDMDMMETELTTEAETVSLPIGANLFLDRGHSYVLYSVKDQEDLLLLLAADGEYHLYYREGTSDPLASDADGT